MDHHCVFTDNCIGRKNFKYFFHFVGWASVALSVGNYFVFFNIFVRNPAHNYGACSILEIVISFPQFLGVKYMLGYGFIEHFNAVTLDSTILLGLFFMTALVAVPAIGTFYNIRTGSS